jgi:membrane protein implicated in regulation of membrane protease activity
MMESVFLACFLFGTVFTLVTAVFGVGHHGLDAGHQGFPSAHGIADDNPLLVFNMSTVVGFLTWFGAAGYLLLHHAGWSLQPTLVVAAVVGLAVGMFIAWFLATVKSGDRDMKAEDYRLEGTVARVTVTIPENGVGEIIFTLAGARRSEAARHESGAAIARETEVAIVSYVDGVARVVPWTELMAAP